MFVGGAIGSLTREAAGPELPAPWPWVPTLLISVPASFLIGWLYGARDRVHPYVMHLAASGFGGFTTFSSLAYQTVDLHRRHTIAHAAANIGASLVSWRSGWGNGLAATY